MADETYTSTGALNGLRVLDLTGRLGGYCGFARQPGRGSDSY